MSLTDLKYAKEEIARLRVLVLALQKERDELRRLCVESERVLGGSIDRWGDTPMHMIDNLPEFLDAKRVVSELRSSLSRQTEGK